VRRHETPGARRAAGVKAVSSKRVKT
jgi:hypothetical protein